MQYHRSDSSVGIGGLEHRALLYPSPICPIPHGRLVVGQEFDVQHTMCSDLQNHTVPALVLSNEDPK